MKKIFIINGVPRAGKNTFVNYCRAYFEYTALTSKEQFQEYSSIDEITKIAYSCFDWLGEKTVKGRTLLSELKDAATKYNNAPYLMVLKKIQNLKEGVLFLYIREPSEIIKITEWCHKYKISCQSILIQNIIASKNNIHQNTGDLYTTKYNYDYIITNNGDLFELEVAAQKFVNEEIFELSPLKPEIKKYKVNVEKCMYATGKIEVISNSSKEAIEMVQNQIDEGELQIDEINWDVTRYEPASFTVTGDVD